MPAGFRLELPAETYALRDSDVWRPAQINFAQQPPRNLTAYTVFARLAPGATFAQAQEELSGIAGQLRAEVAVHEASDLRVKVIPFQHDVVKGARGGLWMLMAAVGLLLAIACVNVALLMLARARGRDRELLVRVAVGAERWRIARLVLAESLIVAVCGGVGGRRPGARSRWWRSARARSANVPRLGDVSIDLAGAGVCGGGLDDLRGGVRAAAGAARRRASISPTRSAPPRSAAARAPPAAAATSLIVTQMALGLMLVVGALPGRPELPRAGRGASRLRSSRHADAARLDAAGAAVRQPRRRRRPTTTRSARRSRRCRA